MLVSMAMQTTRSGGEREDVGGHEKELQMNYEYKEYPGITHVRSSESPWQTFSSSSTNTRSVRFAPRAVMGISGGSARRATPVKAVYPLSAPAQRISRGRSDSRQ